MKKEMAALSFSALSTALLVTAFVAIPKKPWRVLRNPILVLSV